MCICLLVKSCAENKQPFFSDPGKYRPSVCHSIRCCVIRELNLAEGIRHVCSLGDSELGKVEPECCRHVCSWCEWQPMKIVLAKTLVPREVSVRVRYM